MKKIVSIFLICISMLTFVSCSGFFETASNDKTTTSPPEENVIKIGVLDSQSGEDEQGGKQEILGIQFAHKKTSFVTLNEKEYKIKLVVADNESSFPSSKNAAQQLVNEGVCAVIGSYGSAETKGAYDVFKSNGIPVISPFYATEIDNNKESLVFSLCPSLYKEATAMAEYMINTLKISKTSIFCDTEDSSGTAYTVFFKEAFEKLGGETVTENFDSKTADFNRLINSVKENKSHAVYAPLSLKYAKEVIESAVENGLAVPVFASKEWESNIIQSQVSGKNINIFVPSFLDIQYDSNLYVNMTEWLEADEDLIYLNSGSRATTLNLMAYDAYSLLVAAIKQAGSFASQDIIKALCEISYTSSSGQISFDENGNRLNSKISIKKIDTDAS